MTSAGRVLSSEQEMEGWSLSRNETCVVTPCCAFTFSADHTDVATGRYSCPMCDHVTKDWPGLMEILRDIYPADIFTGESGDLGPRVIALLREIDAGRVSSPDYPVSYDRIYPRCPVCRREQYGPAVIGFSQGDYGCHNCGHVIREDARLERRDA